MSYKYMYGVHCTAYVVPLAVQCMTYTVYRIFNMHLLISLAYILINIFDKVIK